MHQGSTLVCGLYAPFVVRICRMVCVRSRVTMCTIAQINMHNIVFGKPYLHILKCMRVCMHVHILVCVHARRGMYVHMTPILCVVYAPQCCCTSCPPISGVVQYTAQSSSILFCFV